MNWVSRAMPHRQSATARSLYAASSTSSALVGGKLEKTESDGQNCHKRKLLDEVDPKQNWGGLKKILTPEGHYLWLCSEHAKEYKFRR